MVRVQSQNPRLRRRKNLQCLSRKEDESRELNQEMEAARRGPRGGILGKNIGFYEASESRRKLTGCAGVEEKL